MLKLRQRLIPYLYTLFEECHRTGAPILRPLFWAYPEDTATYPMDDEFLCGDALLVAPITHPGTEYRHVYIPAGIWFHFWTGARVDGPAHILAHAPLGQPALYVRANTAVPLWPEMQHVGEKPADPLTLLLYPAAGSGQATLYEDAGDGYEHLDGAYARRTIICEASEEQINVTVSTHEGKFVPTCYQRRIHFELRGVSSAPENVRVEGASAAWHYDAAQKSIIVDLHETVHTQAIDLSVYF